MNTVFWFGGLKESGMQWARKHLIDFECSSSNWPKLKMKFRSPTLWPAKSSKSMGVGYCSKLLLWQKKKNKPASQSMPVKKISIGYVYRLLSFRDMPLVIISGKDFFSVCGKNSPWAVNIMLGQCKLLGKCLIVKWQGGLQIFKVF